MEKSKQIVAASLIILAVGGVAYLCMKSKERRKSKRKNMPVYIV
ncbi:hypothetical protein [Dysgonomonas sp. 216]|nr:hypothetical protein [Dysgonomonas sp. 216]